MKKLLGTSFLLEIDTVTNPDTAVRGVDSAYKPVVCASQNGVDLSRAKQTTSNKCDEGFESSLPGIANWSFSIDGQVVDLITAEKATQENYETILALALAGTVFFGRITDEEQTIYREGKVWISAYTEALPNAEAYTFTATLEGTGQLFDSPPTT